MKKIGTKVIICIISCALIMTFFIGSVSLMKSKALIETTTKSNLVRMVESKKDLFNSELHHIETHLEDLARVVETTLDLDKARSNPNYIQAYLNGFKPLAKATIDAIDIASSLDITINPEEINNQIGEIWYLRGEDGEGVLQPTTSNTSIYSRNEPTMAWFYDSLDKKVDFWMDAYTSSLTKDITMSYCYPIIIADKAIGVATINIDFDHFVKFVTNYQILETGFLYVTNKDNEITIHPVKDMVNTYLEDYFNKKELKYFAENESGLFESNIGGVKSFVAFCNSKDNNFIVQIPKSEVTKELMELLSFMVVLIILGSIAIVVFASLFGNRLAKPILFVTSTLEKISDFNLTLDINEHKLLNHYTKRDDELGTMATALRKVYYNLNNILNNITSTSNSIVESVSELTIATNESTHSIGDISKAIEELAKGSNEQALQVENSSRKLDSLAQDINKTLQEGSQVEKNSEFVQTTTLEGTDSIKKLVDKFKVNVDSTNEVKENISALTEKSILIEKVLANIIGVSEQINLLSLNAAIEAARAGEHGRGFSVVADEIRKLSVSTSELTGEISESLSSINTYIFKANNSIKTGSESLEEVRMSIKDARKAFSSISESVAINKNSVDLLKEKLLSIESNKNDTLLAMENMSALTEEFVASSEEVSASSEEQLATLETINNNINNLNDTIKSLDSIISEFKL